MRKTVRLIGLLLLLCVLFYIASLAEDKQTLSSNLIRLHVVADSDDELDQQIKLYVKDKVVTFIQDRIPQSLDATKAKFYLMQSLPEIEEIANDTLIELGCDDRAKVSLTKESFNVRQYDTFSLPSGVYESLRIELGEGRGKNWWCVVFPSLCIPTTKDDFTDTAVSAGFDKELTATLSGDKQYEIRFFFLDCLGKIENFFFFSK